MQPQGQELFGRPLSFRPASRSRKRARITPCDDNNEPPPLTEPLKITDLPTDTLQTILELACEGNLQALAASAMACQGLRQAAAQVQTIKRLDTTETCCNDAVPWVLLKKHAACIEELRAEGPHQPVIEICLAVCGRFPNLRNLTYTNKYAAFAVVASDSLESAALSSDVGVILAPGRSLRHLALSGSGHMVVENALSEEDNGIVKLIYNSTRVRDDKEDLKSDRKSIVNLDFKLIDELPPVHDNYQQLIALLEELPKLEELKYCTFATRLSACGAVFGRLRVLELEVPASSEIFLRTPLPALEVLGISAMRWEPHYATGRIYITAEFLTGSPNLREYNTDAIAFTTVGEFDADDPEDNPLMVLGTTSLEHIVMRINDPFIVPMTAKTMALAGVGLDGESFRLQPQIETLILPRFFTAPAEIDWHALKVLVASVDVLPLVVHDALQADGPPWLDIYLESEEGRRKDFKAVRKLGPIVKSITVQLAEPPTGGKGMYMGERSLKKSLKKSCPHAERVSVVYPDTCEDVDINKYFLQHHDIHKTI